MVLLCSDSQYSLGCVIDPEFLATLAEQFESLKLALWEPEPGTTCILSASFPYLLGSHAWKGVLLSQVSQSEKVKTENVAEREREMLEGSFWR